jgi:hypothetical protein
VLLIYGGDDRAITADKRTAFGDCGADLNFGIATQAYLEECLC